MIRTKIQDHPGVKTRPLMTQNHVKTQGFLHLINVECCVCVCVCLLFSHVQPSATPQTIPHQAPLSMEFSRQQHWSGQPLPSPGDLPEPGIESRFPVLQADSLPPESPGSPECRDSDLIIYTSVVSHVIWVLKNILRDFKVSQYL